MALRKARLIDCREQNWCEKALAALQCGAFHISTAGLPYFKHHAIRPRCERHHAGGRMKEDGVHIWVTAATYKGNDIERFYRYA